jgi:hypothetical protein
MYSVPGLASTLKGPTETHGLRVSMRRQGEILTAGARSSR